MDNITHSVVGLGIGALIDRSLPPEPDTARHATRGRMLLTICWLASNFPDLGLVATRLLEKPLGYLLMHRGHTHTVLGLAIEMIVLLGLTWLLWPNARRLVRASSPARHGAILAAAAGLVLHVAMDGLNVYGVHPFWPFDGRWIYGDLVFIVEPVFWIGFGIPLAMLARSVWVRWLVPALFALAFAAFAFKLCLHPASLAALFVLGALLAWLSRAPGAPRDAVGHRGRKALAAGLAASLAFVGMQAVALQMARTAIGTELARLDPGERLLDTALSAYPANPACWSFVTVESDEAHGSYRLRRGMVSIAPGIVPVTACPARIAGFVPAGDARLAWTANERQSLATLRDADRMNCHLHAWMRFARAPLLTDGSANDARYGTRGAPDFTLIDYADLAGAPCPTHVPGWGIPRADLLAPSTASVKHAPE